MADPHATTKELAVLQKQVDQLSKAFDAEKKVVHTELDQKSVAARVDENFNRVKDTFAERKQWFDDEKKVVHEELDGLTKRIEKEEKLTEDTFAERKQWFDDEKKVVHGELDGLDKSLKELKKWVEEELKKLKK
jgi:hypothetical protein